MCHTSYTPHLFFCLSCGIPHGMPQPGENRGVCKTRQIHMVSSTALAGDAGFALAFTASPAGYTLYLLKHVLSFCISYIFMTQCRIAAHAVLCVFSHITLTIYLYLTYHYQSNLMQSVQFYQTPDQSQSLLNSGYIDAVLSASLFGRYVTLARCVLFY